MAELGGTEIILVVDDESALLDLVCEILSGKGYHVISAGSAQQALNILESESIDLLFSDVIMPGMDGYQLASIVQEKYPTVKIQLASGFNENHHFGVTDDELHKRILQKPVNTEKLLKQVRTLLDE